MAKRVYFAFTYQDVIDFRANVVRNHKFAKGVEAAGYYDHSIWEDAKNTNPEVLKRLINTELENTSVTVVLIGSDTWSRRWVRYEIFQTLKRGNSLFGIHINGIKGKDGLTKASGPDPFNNLGIEFNAEGNLARPTEWSNSAWRFNTDTGPYALLQTTERYKGQHVKLLEWCPIRGWVSDDGYNNFGSWVGS
jgi:hypothetical protein